MRMRSGCGLALLLAVACSPGADEPAQADTARVPEPAAAALPDTSDSDPASVQGLRCDSLEAVLLRAAPATRAQLRRVYGEPDSVVAAAEPNRHTPGVIDSLFEVRYDGLRVHIRTPGGSRVDMPTSVDATANRFLRYPAIGIGAPAARIVSVLGAPRLQVDDRLVYDCGEHVEQPVTFRLSKGVVTGIEVAYYVD